MKALIKILVVATLFGSSTVLASKIYAGKESCPSQGLIGARNTSFMPENLKTVPTGNTSTDDGKPVGSSF